MCDVTLNKQLKNQLKSLNLNGRDPIAVIFAEDDIGLQETLQHTKKIGFLNIIVLGPNYSTGNIRAGEGVYVIPYDPDVENAISSAINIVISVFAGHWIYYCYNSEFMYFPFCETRKINDLVGFLEEERRCSALSYTVDLYPEEITSDDDGFDLEGAHFDTVGYFALNRRTSDGKEELEKQIDVFGGLRWRYLQYVPWERRRISKSCLFKATPDLGIDEELNFSLPDYETFSVPWHNSPTVATCSFRAAKYLRFNPESRKEVRNFMWERSLKFDHNSEQLMNLGMIEPGQWF